MDVGQIGETVAKAVERLPLGPLLESLDSGRAYLAGGWARDLVAGREPDGDVDIAVEGDMEALLGRLERDAGAVVHRQHERFGTATVLLDGLRVDLSQTRRERYPEPGALPEVEPAPIEEDLGRRDFTVNAIAVELSPPHGLLDPHGGIGDVRGSVLRILHERSFTDDPTRAIRAARYAARLDLAPDAATLAALRATDLDTVSADRRVSELARLAAEERAPRGFELLFDWGLLAAPPGGLALVRAVDELAGDAPWDEPARSRAILIAAGGGPRREAAVRLARAEPERPSEAVQLAAGHDQAELLLAAAAGGGWVEELATKWSRVALEISGGDLVDAGVPEGPAIGIALRGTLERKLDGGLHGGRDAELALALELARKARPPI